MVPWTEADRRRVEEALARHPIESGRCATAAGEVLPLARGLDRDSRLLKLLPRGAARYVVCKRDGVPYFRHPVLVEVSTYDVDALTGADGIAAADYLEAHWQYPPELRFLTIGVEDLSEL